MRHTHAKTHTHLHLQRSPQQDAVARVHGLGGEDGHVVLKARPTHHVNQRVHSLKRLHKSGVVGVRLQSDQVLSDRGYEIEGIPC
jgi:hypothetical protein